MPIDDLYWNSIDFGSEESLHNIESRHQQPLSLMSSTTKHYVDPWDLENYAYIRQHLHSANNSTGPSSSDTEFIGGETNSFYYLPGGKFDSILTEQGTYAAIDENRTPRSDHLYSHVPKADLMTDESAEYFAENVYEENIKDSNSLQYGYGPNKDRWQQAFTSERRDRSLSFSYGDYNDYNKPEIYSKLDDRKKNSTLPVLFDDTTYDDIESNNKNSNTKPKNFGLSKYGHLKIDYSYSWNNLNKYICN